MKKKYFSLFIALVSFGTANAQRINFTESNTGTQFKDARNGSLAAADVDNDGDVDVFISGKNKNVVEASLFLNDGQGSFSLANGTSFAGLQFGSAEFADVDMDGDVDLLHTGSSFPTSGTFANLYVNNGQGEFTLANNTPFEASSGGDIVFQDIDNDKDPDLMMVGYDKEGNGFTKLYQNNGSGSYTELTTSTFQAAKSGSIAFLDFDKDGDKDVIISGQNNSDSARTSLYKNNGSGVFTLVLNTPFTGVSSGDIAIADTDNDGDADVVVSGSAGGVTNVTNLYLNDGSGSFSLVPAISFPKTSLGSTDVADFDNDGDMDILITGSIKGAQFAGHIFENLGSNKFVVADTLNPMYLTSTAISDFDGDNDLDIVVVGISNTTTAFKSRLFVNNLALVTVSETVMRADIHLYPNPSDNEINILSDKPLVEIEVFSSTGRLMYRTSSVSDTFRLDIDEYESGLYYVRLFDEEHNVSTFKVLKKQERIH